MKRVLLDTSGAIALLNEDDYYHQNASSVLDTITLIESVEFVITDYVLIEVCNTFSKLLWRETAAEFLTAVENDSHYLFIKIDENRFNRSVKLFQQYSDKEWSLTDCSSFLIMQELRIAEAFTHDKHFEQAGFTRLII